MPSLLQVSDLQTYFFSCAGTRVVKAVDSVSFSLHEGETLGLVGESGCGKTTSKLNLLQEKPSAGTIRFDGEDIFALQGQGLMRYRRDVQVVFQDPYSSLSPRMRVGEIHCRTPGDPH
jgi:ABC-type microcin C transport system duplicated ATPase subunit YejF